MPFSLKEFLGNSAAKVVTEIGSALDNNITSDEERLKVKEEITKIITESNQKILDVQKEVMLAEIHGNKYQRSWRPSLMYVAMFIIFTSWFVFPLINVWLQNEELSEFIRSLKDADKFWQIILMGVGAFGIGRTAEKMTRDVVNNVDVSLRRKK